MLGSFELQKLHGMGDLLYTLVCEQHPHICVRTYAPVGQHEDLLPYLVRRLLENGANSSFVNRFLDEQLPVDDLIVDPFAKQNNSDAPLPSAIPLPEAIFFNAAIPWKAARGFDLDDRD